MLELKKIKKDYLAGENTVHALKGIDLTFRSAEFVSILGPSGCGKTTMLNIIGGLDKYSSGDLFINGRSTKDFKDRDWDTYRNHSIGFVFQSYNLIPHQSVLQNVELALTLSGVKKAERRARAKKALIDVGLDGQFKKRPSEMSGGQMQRVAIARALVNNPDIILADEPTGALDTETSVQVMEILKEISKNKLVIMVTHNPDLAAKYSTRIINMLDGEITGDSNPITNNELKDEKVIASKRLEEESRMKKPSMSFFTSFGLSLKNLFTKKGRTLLTSFAGSIGIIGISLILAVSQGTTAFINSVQESALSSYPITLEASTVQLSSVIEAFMNISNEGNKHENDAVYKKAALYNMISALNNIQETKNDLKSFKEFLESNIETNSELNNALNAVQYSYDLNLHIYTKTVDGKILRSDLEEIITKLMIKHTDIDMSSMTSMSQMMPMSNMTSMSAKLWQELLPGKDGTPINELIYTQYEPIYGNWPKEFNEIVLVVDKNNELDDVTLYALGLLPEEEIDKLADAAINHTDLGESKEFKWSYEDILNSEYKVILNPDIYEYDETTGTYRDLTKNEIDLNHLYSNALSLKVVGIIRPTEDSDATLISGNICYTNELTKYVIEHNQNAPSINAQLATPNVDIFTGLTFDSSTGTLTPEEKKEAFLKHYGELDTKGKADLYVAMMSIPSDELIQQTIDQAIGGKTKQEIIDFIVQSGSEQAAQSTEKYIDFLNEMPEDKLIEYISAEIEKQTKAAYAKATSDDMASIPDEQLAGMLDMWINLTLNPTPATPENQLPEGQIPTTEIPEGQLPTTEMPEGQIPSMNIPEGQIPSTQLPEGQLPPMDIPEGQVPSAPPAQTPVLAPITSEQFVKYYDEIMKFSESSYEKNLIKLGYIDLESPSKINLYASSFENKDIIVAEIDKYNSNVDEMKQIKYTDYFGIIMSSVTTIINAITYVLIAFVSISLIVSSIMIGVITLISVQERTKEIGILRAIGASKRDVSGMFNAETMIVGFASGLLGVTVTYLLCIPINIILKHLTGLASLKAVLPINAAVILVIISVCLTLISGFIPSRSAAKKDPVVALRTE